MNSLATPTTNHANRSRSFRISKMLRNIRRAGVIVGPSAISLGLAYADDKKDKNDMRSVLVFLLNNSICHFCYSRFNGICHNPITTAWIP